jgi:hypothetical protein
MADRKGAPVRSMSRATPEKINCSIKRPLDNRRATRTGTARSGRTDPPIARNERQVGGAGTGRGKRKAAERGPDRQTSAEGGANYVSEANRLSAARSANDASLARDLLSVFGTFPAEFHFSLKQLSFQVILGMIPALRRIGLQFKGTLFQLLTTSFFCHSKKHANFSLA